MPRAKRARPEEAAAPDAAPNTAAAAAAAAPAAPPALKKRLHAPAPAPSDTEDADDSSDDEPRAGAGAGAVDDALARQVFVEGLPYTASEADIAHFFDGCGSVAGIKAPKWQDSGRLRGYAHVTFATRAGAQLALARDGRYLGERFINVARAKPTSTGAAAALAVASRPRPKGCATLFVGNLPYECDEAGVRAAFAPFGSVASVRLTRWTNTGRLKGVGYVQFAVGLSCDAAMKAYREGVSSGGATGGVRVGARLVTLDYDTAGPRASFKTAEGQSFFKTDEAGAVRGALAQRGGSGGGSGGGGGGGGSGGGGSGARR